jgi:hypothetical protein
MYVYIYLNCISDDLVKDITFRAEDGFPENLPEEARILIAVMDAAPPDNDDDPNEAVTRIAGFGWKYVKKDEYVRYLRMPYLRFEDGYWEWDKPKG